MFCLRWKSKVVFVKSQRYLYGLTSKLQIRRAIRQKTICVLYDHYSTIILNKKKKTTNLFLLNKKPNPETISKKHLFHLHYRKLPGSKAQWISPQCLISTELANTKGFDEKEQIKAIAISLLKLLHASQFLNECWESADSLPDKTIGFCQQF